MNLLAKAIRIASVAFEDIQDKGGKPYILHCLWVMDKVRHLGEDYMIVAILHDLIEDTNWTLEQLEEEGFPLKITAALELLNFKTTDNYIRRIKVIKEINDIATQVKLRDLEHNSKITRLKGIEDKDIQRLKKYSEAYTILKPNRR